MGFQLGFTAPMKEFSLGDLPIQSARAITLGERAQLYDPPSDALGWEFLVLGLFLADKPNQTKLNGVCTMPNTRMEIISRVNFMSVLPT